MARKDESPAVYVANSSGTIRINGIRYTYLRRQTILPADHPLVRRLPARFSLLKVEGMRTPPEVVAVAPVPEMSARLEGITES